MENVILIIGVMIFFILGFHIMKRVDLFINENDKRISKDIKIKEPSSVRLS